MIRRSSVTCFLTSLTLIGLVNCQTSTGNCTQVSPCKCIFDDGTVLDLRSLSREDGQPFFHDIEDKDKDIYFWNPCFPFTHIPDRNDSECTNVAVCMERLGFPKTLIYDLGKHDSAQIHRDENGTLEISYHADKGDFDLRTNIQLRCSPTLKSDILLADIERDLTNTTKLYTLVLLSKYACGLAPTINPAHPRDDSLGGGAIFAIVLFSLIGAYLVFGTLFQFASGKRGKRMFPNHDFWCIAVPGICKGSAEKISGGDKGSKYDSI